MKDDQFEPFSGVGHRLGGHAQSPPYVIRGGASPPPYNVYYNHGTTSYGNTYRSSNYGGHWGFGNHGNQSIHPGFGSHFSRGNPHTNARAKSDNPNYVSIICKKKVTI